MREEERTMKAVGRLLSELHSEYHGTREIAMAQLILLGDKAVPYLWRFLEKELNLEKDLRNYRELDAQAKQRYDSLSRSDFENARVAEQSMDKVYGDVRRYEREFKVKWEREPANYRMEAGYETDQNLINARLLAIESLSSVFEAVGDEKGAKTASALLLDFKEYAGIT